MRTPKFTLLAALLVLFLAVFAVSAHESEDTDADGDYVIVDDGSDDLGGSDDGSDALGGSDDGSDVDGGSDDGSDDNGSDDGGNPNPPQPVVCKVVADCGKSQFAQCCGGKCIDTRRNTCVNNIRCPNTTNAVCGTKCYNTARFGCHNNQVVCPLGQNLCGESRCYNPSVNFCGGNSKVCKSGSQYYCPEANQCYNFDSFYCCATTAKLCPVATLQWKNNTCCPPAKVAPGCNKLNPLHCGPKKCYSPTTSDCYSTVGTICRKGFGVCGTRCYNTSVSFCPDSQVLCRNGQWFCSEAGKCYDPKTQSCCATKGKVCSLNSTTCCAALPAGGCLGNNDCTLGNQGSALRCCGGKCIDSSKVKCIFGKSCPLNSDGVCGATCYNTSSQGCFNNQILCPIGQSLCGTKCFDPKRAYCAGSSDICLYNQWFCAEAKKCYNPKTQSCCSSQKKICPLTEVNGTAPCCTYGVVKGCNNANPLPCGTKCYNPSVGGCYNNQTVCAHGSGICDQRCYNFTKSYCPDGVNLCASAQWFCSEASSCFSPATQFCCASRRKVCNLKDAATCCN